MSVQFFIIGGQRCGTTFLYKALDAHPEICMAQPIRPEPKYFLNEDFLKEDRTHYQRLLFPDQQGCKAMGEKSTSYYETEEAPARIKQKFNDAKIVMILRDPVERAMSNYFFSRKNGLETRSLREVFIDNVPAPVLNKQISVSPFNYLGRSNYLPYLQRFLDEFSPSNLHVLIFEELLENKVEVFTNLFDFLQVNSNWHGYSSERINSAEREEENAEVRKVLSEEFAQSSQQLALKLNKPLMQWWPSMRKNS